MFFGVKRKKIRGFTVIEILITLGIIGALFAMAVPKVWNYQQEELLDETAQNLITFIVQAKNLAVYKREQSQIEAITGGEVDKEVIGTVLTFEPPQADYTRVAIREWGYKKMENPAVDFDESQNDSTLVGFVNTRESPTSYSSVSYRKLLRWLLHNNSCEDKDNIYSDVDNSPYCKNIPLYFPIIKDLRLPKNVFIDKERSLVFIKAEGSASTPVPTPSIALSPLLQTIDQPYVFFLGYRNGETDGLGYDLDPAVLDKLKGVAGLRVSGYVQIVIQLGQDSKTSLKRVIQVSIPQGLPVIMPPS